MDNLDAFDLSYLGMGSYINEKDSIPEENKDFEDLDEVIDEIKTNYITEKFKEKQILRPFEQHVQKSIKKIKNKI